MTNDGIAWFLEGRPIRLDPTWRAGATTQGGWRSFEGTGEASRALRLAEQGARIEGFRPDGQHLWAGDLVLDPVTRDGVVSLEADGPAATLDSLTQRMFFQSRDPGLFVQADADPHGYTFSEKFDADAKPGKLDYVAQSGETYANGQKAGLVAWIEGDEINEFTWTMHKNADLGNFDQTLYVADGPSGALTLKQTRGLGAANPTGTVFTTTNIGRDLVQLALEANAANTPTQRRRVWVTDPILRGRCGSADVFTVPACLEAVFAEAGLLPDIASSPLDAMPLDWTEGLTDLADYLAALVDWWWGVLSLERGTGIGIASAGPFEDVVEVAREADAAVELDTLRRYNGARVEFESTSGVQRSVTVSADPDPFPGQSVIAGPDVHGVTIEDRQFSSAMPTALATKLAAFYSSERRVGKVTVARARRADGGPDLSPYEIVPGLLMDISDHDPPIPPQRAVAVEYQAGGLVSVDLNVELSPEYLLAHTAKGRRHRGRKRHHGGR